MTTRLAQAPGSAAGAATHFRGGEGPPLVLIHGYANPWRVWEPVLPALTERHDVLAPTLCGHFQGEPLAEGVEATVGALTDGVERAMDAAGFETAHVCGNSLGGWIALDLGRRGRARSVNCLAPAGGWEHGSRPERLTPAQAAARMEAMAHCTVYWELLDTITRDGPPDWLGEVDAPTLVAWPEVDRVLPQKGHSEPFRELVRGAEGRGVRPGRRGPW